MNIHGFDYFPNYYDRAQQQALLAEIRQIARDAPLFQPVMPKTGTPMRVQQTNCGALGWVSDQHRGYRYQSHHPITGKPWPAIPKILQTLWHELSNYPAAAQACLINFYDSHARMGLHQDKDEDDLQAPVISVSLGDSCSFRIGGLERHDKTHSIKLHSGDVIIFGGKARLFYHGVDRIYPATSTLLKTSGRINLTLRRVSQP